MCDGYDDSGISEDAYADLDEYLCEYVDGAMDCAVREAFEEYLHANPALAEHVASLQHTRTLLCCYGCRKHAPQGLQARLRQRLCREMMQDPPLSLGAAIAAPALPWRVLAVSASLVLMVLAGSVMLGEAPSDEATRHQVGAEVKAVPRPAPAAPLYHRAQAPYRAAGIMTSPSAFLPADALVVPDRAGVGAPPDRLVLRRFDGAP